MDDIEANGGDKDGNVSSTNANSATTTQSLARVILHNRALVDGYRGLAISLVLIEHLTKHNSFIVYLHVDEKVFIIITGFMLALQELLTAETSTNEASTLTSSNNKFLPFTWLRSRAIGLFPLYWIALILNAPRLYTDIGGFELHLNDSQMFGFVMLHILALQDWSPIWSDNINIYYISLIWNVFIIYACYKTIYLSTYNIFIKFIGIGTITIFLVLMDAYYNHLKVGVKAILSPQWGFIFFAVGFLAAVLFSKIYKSEQWKNFIARSTMKSQEENALIQMEKHDDNTYVPKQQLDLALSSSSSSSSVVDYDNRCWHYRNITSYATDFLAGLFIILVFTSLGSDNENTATVMVYFILPLIFLALLITSFLQPTVKTQSSFFTRLLKTQLFVIMGQSSLAIYMFHNILIFYYYNNAILAGQHHYHGSPYTRTFMAKYNSDGNNLQFKNGFYDVIAFLIVIPFGIFMQKVVQDRMIPSLINYIEVLYQKKFYYGSCHDIITEQNNVLLEKATVDVDKDI